MNSKMNFGQWKFSKGLRYISDHTYKDNNNYLYDADIINKMYDEYLKLCIKVK